MQNTINVLEDDILWRFYCKRFTAEGKEVESPNNLCRYFWTSVMGFGLWLGREVRLQRLWLINLFVTAILSGIVWVIPDTDNAIVTILVITVAVLWNFSFLVALCVSLYRVKRVVEARAPWVIYLLGFCFIILIITHLVTQGTLWPEFTRIFGDLLRWMGYMLIVTVVLLIFTLILSTIPHRRLQKLWKVFQTFSAFVIAKKNRICPPVNPPENFHVSL